MISVEPVVKIKVNGMDVEDPYNLSVKDAAKLAGCIIPGICDWPGDEKPVGWVPNGTCRLCSASVNGRIVQACETKVVEGMEIVTNSVEVMKRREAAFELIMTNHPLQCPTCPRNGSCDLLEISKQFSPLWTQGFVTERTAHEPIAIEKDRSSASIWRDSSFCINCMLCVAMCDTVQKIGALGQYGRGWDSKVGTPEGLSLAESDCIGCGQCRLVCPTGAISVASELEAALEALENPNCFVVGQFAPAVRVALGELFNVDSQIVTGKIYSAMNLLGVKGILDTSFAADLTTLVELHEFMGRLTNGGKLPMFTSCCPGWVNFVEAFYPEMIPHLSTCKSPQQMLGAMVKTDYAERSGVNPKSIVSLSVMPCTAKKGEKLRATMDSSGYPDVDIVLTTEEFGQLLRMKGIDFASLPEGSSDALMSDYTGAGAIFGASGGVAEAVAREAVFELTGKDLQTMELQGLRGPEAKREATVQIGDVRLRVCVISGIGNIHEVIGEILQGEVKYDLIEVMACPGGCRNGGGQPRRLGINSKGRDKRQEALYQVDRNSKMRVGHQNSRVKELIERIGGVDGQRAHELLHTTYKEKLRVNQ